MAAAAAAPPVSGPWANYPPLAQISPSTTGRLPTATWRNQGVMQITAEALANCHAGQGLVPGRWMYEDMPFSCSFCPVIYTNSRRNLQSNTTNVRVSAATACILVIRGTPVNLEVQGLGVPANGPLNDFKVIPYYSNQSDRKVVHVDPTYIEVLGGSTLPALLAALNSTATAPVVTVYAFPFVSEAAHAMRTSDLAQMYSGLGGTFSSPSVAWGFSGPSFGLALSYALFGSRACLATGYPGSIAKDVTISVDDQGSVVLDKVTEDAGMIENIDLIYFKVAYASQNGTPLFVPWTNNYGRSMNDVLLNAARQAATRRPTTFTPPGGSYAPYTMKTWDPSYTGAEGIESTGSFAMALYGKEKQRIQLAPNVGAMQNDIYSGNDYMQGISYAAWPCAVVTVKTTYDAYNLNQAIANSGAPAAQVYNKLNTIGNSNDMKDVVLAGVAKVVKERTRPRKTKRVKKAAKPTKAQLMKKARLDQEKSMVAQNAALNSLLQKVGVVGAGAGGSSFTQSQGPPPPSGGGGGGGGGGNDDDDDGNNDQGSGTRPASMAPDAIRAASMATDATRGRRRRGYVQPVGNSDQQQAHEDEALASADSAGLRNAGAYGRQNAVRMLVGDADALQNFPRRGTALQHELSNAYKAARNTPRGGAAGRFVKSGRAGGFGAKLGQALGGIGGDLIDSLF
jgi:hypothetical protein